MKNKKILDRIVDRWPVKVLSIAAAILLFMFNRMSALEERFFSVPLKVNLDGTLVPASSYPRVARVTLRGEANTIFPILEEDIEAFIDLTRYKTEGVYKAPVQIRRKGTASAADPLEIHVEPLEVAVALERKVVKSVPVTPSFRGYLESGFELSSYSIDPPQVEISGPASLMEKVSDVTTDFVELSGKKEDFSVAVKILNRDPLISIKGDAQVIFKGTIQQSVAIRTFERLPIVISGLPQGFIARPQVNYGSVRLQGSQNDLDTFEPDASFLSLDCSNVDDAGLYILPLIVSAPPQFTVVRFDPMEVAVEIQREKPRRAGEENR